jgi:hypothetical protein
VPRYLLDANLSPKVARFLARRPQVEVISAPHVTRFAVSDPVL